jgi:hypothetical protein
LGRSPWQFKEAEPAASVAAEIVFYLKGRTAVCPLTGLIFIWPMSFRIEGSPQQMIVLIVPSLSRASARLNVSSMVIF